MKTGMLWFDNNATTDLPAKVLAAALYYQKKYGHKPTLCHVHPSMLAGLSPNTDGITIRPDSRVLPNHLWVGMSETTPIST